MCYTLLLTCMNVSTAFNAVIVLQHVISSVPFHPFILMITYFVMAFLLVCLLSLYPYPKRVDGLFYTWWLKPGLGSTTARESKNSRVQQRQHIHITSLSHNSHYTDSVITGVYNIWKFATCQESRKRILFRPPKL